mgnify:CR=1 FL=1
MNLLYYPKFNALTLLLIIIVIAILLITCSKPQIKEKPQSIIIQGNREIPGYNKLHTIDIVTMKNSEIIKDMNTVTLNYHLSETTETINNELFTIWNQEIQKILLRKGFNILQNATPDELFEEDNNPKEGQTVCTIDVLTIRKESEVTILENNNIPKPFQYMYSYFVAEISAYISHNNTIVWRGNVTITSFDLLNYKKLINQPILFYKAVTDYVYSKKVNDWIKQNMELLVTDNFTKYYSSNSDESLHKKELIAYAVQTLFTPLKAEK